MSDEFLRRLAERASEIDLLERWPKTQAEATEEGKHKRHHHKEDSESDSESDTDMEESKQSIQSMGDAAPYMFQKRLTIESTWKKDEDGTTWQRHMSSFYRRPCHTVSCKLYRIMPDDFVHCIWISPNRKTYGPPLRHVLEHNGDAIPIPLCRDLHYCYRHDEPDRAKDEPYISDVLTKRIQRIIPYDMSFQHLTLTIKETDIVFSEAPREGGPWQPLRSCTDFFCRSDFEHVASKDSNTPNPASQRDGPPPNGTSKKPLSISVAPDSAVARAIREVTGGQSHYLAQNVTSRMVTRPPDGVITQKSIQLLSSHVLAAIRYS